MLIKQVTIVSPFALIDKVCTLYGSTAWAFLWILPIYIYILSHGVKTLKRHAQLIAKSTSGDGDEVGVSFNKSSISFETASEISLSNGYLDWYQTSK